MKVGNERWQPFTESGYKTPYTAAHSSLQDEAKLHIASSMCFCHMQDQLLSVAVSLNVVIFHLPEKQRIDRQMMTSLSNNLVEYRK